MSVMPLLLVRHAKAGSRYDWEGHDSQRPLSKAGRRQAEALAGRLVEWKPERVLSSPAVRCVQTVEPLAAALGTTVEVVDDLAEGCTPSALRLVRRLGGSPVVLCTHGDIVPEVLWSLAEEGADVPRRLTWPKASTWVLEHDGGRFTRAIYLPPPVH